MLKWTTYVWVYIADTARSGIEQTSDKDLHHADDSLLLFGFILLSNGIRRKRRYLESAYIDHEIVLYKII